MPLYPPAVQTVMDPWSTHDCRLDWVDTTTIKLSRFGGQWLMINGVRCVIPVNGLTLNVSALNGNYYIYVRRTGNAVTTLAAAAGSYANDNFGMPCLNSDGEATMVGMAYVGGGGMVHAGYVCSYWNRKQFVRTSPMVTGSHGSTTPIYLASNELNIVFTTFANEVYEQFCCGTAWGLDVAGLIVYIQADMNNTRLGWYSAVCPRYAGWYAPITQKVAVPAPGDGAHNASIQTWVNAPGYTAQWQLVNGLRWLA
jgi:hypothetical protein